jgi:hypothetical protein
MRFIAALAGLIVALPVTLFFWIGSQTFTRPAEHVFAVMITYEGAALIALSIGSLLVSKLRYLQYAVGAIFAATLALMAVSI